MARLFREMKQEAGQMGEAGELWANGLLRSKQNLKFKSFLTVA